MKIFCFTLLFILTLSTINAQNIISADSSFESGPAGLVATSYDGSVRWQQVTDTAFDGQHSLKVTFPQKSWANSRTISLKNGSYTFSIYAKAATDNVSAWLAVWKPWNSVIMKNINLTKEWQRFSVTGNIKSGECWLCLGANVPAEIWTDAWQLEKGSKLTDYAQNKPLCIGLDIPVENDRIFYKDEIIPLKTTAINSTNQTEQLELDIIIQDAFNQTIFQKSQIITVKPKSMFSIKDDFQPTQNGFYIIKTKLKKNDKVISDFYSTVTVVNKPLSVTTAKLPFCGVNGAGWLRPGIFRIGAKWQEIPIRWNHMEKHQGKIDWNMLELAKQLKTKGFSIKATIMGVPKWAWDQAETADALKHKKSTGHYGLLPSVDGMQAWQEFLKKLVKDYQPLVDIWEIGAEDDLNWGRNEYYRFKYAKYVKNTFATGPFGERVAAFYDAGISAIRSVNPNAKLGLLRPSGVDCTNRNYTFSKAVLKHVKNKYDYFPLDPYCWPRYLGKGEPASDGPETYLNGDFERALQLTEEVGQQQPVYVSEYGYAVNANEPITSPYHLELAKLLSRSCLLSKLNPNVKLFQWYVTQAATEGDKARYAMWWGDNPMPVTAAYSQVTSIVENSHESKRLDIGGDVNMLIFNKQDSANAAIWSPKDKGKIEFTGPLPNAIIVNYLGTQLNTQITPGTILQFDDAPIFITLTGTDAFQSLEKCLQTANILFKPVSTVLLTPFTTKAELYVKNRLNTPLVSQLEVAFNQEPYHAQGNSIEITQADTHQYDIAIPKNAKSLNYKLNTNAKLKTVLGSYNLNFKPIYKLDTITIDGKLDDWPSKNQLSNFKGRACINPPDPFIPYQGNDDLSADIYCGWNDKFFYFAAKVKDDIHKNTNTDYRIWSGDCIQLAMDMMGNAIANDKQGYDSDDIEMGIASTEKKGQEFYPWFGNKLDLIRKTSYSIIRDENNQTTIYELKTPWKALRFKPEKNKVFAMNYVVLDDDDGSGAPYWIQLTPGITGSKTPKAFQKFYLKTE